MEPLNNVRGTTPPIACTSAASTQRFHESPLALPSVFGQTRMLPVRPHFDLLTSASSGRISLNDSGEGSPEPAQRFHESPFGLTSVLRQTRMLPVRPRFDSMPPISSGRISSISNDSSEGSTESTQRFHESPLAPASVFGQPRMLPVRSHFDSLPSTSSGPVSFIRNDSSDGKSLKRRPAGSSFSMTGKFKKNCLEEIQVHGRKNMVETVQPVSVEAEVGTQSSSPPARYETSEFNLEFNDIEEEYLIEEEQEDYDDPVVQAKITADYLAQKNAKKQQKKSSRRPQSTVKTHRQLIAVPKVINETNDEPFRIKVSLCIKNHRKHQKDADARLITLEASSVVDFLLQLWGCCKPFLRRRVQFVTQPGDDAGFTVAEWAVEEEYELQDLDMDHYILIYDPSGKRYQVPTFIKNNPRVIAPFRDSAQVLNCFVHIHGNMVATQRQFLQVTELNTATYDKDRSGGPSNVAVADLAKKIQDRYKKELASPGLGFMMWARRLVKIPADAIDAEIEKGIPHGIEHLFKTSDESIESAVRSSRNDLRVSRTMCDFIDTEVEFIISELSKLETGSKLVHARALQMQRVVHEHYKAHVAMNQTLRVVESDYSRLIAERVSDSVDVDHNDRQL